VRGLRGVRGTLNQRPTPAARSPACSRRDKRTRRRWPRAAQALATLDATDDDALAPWDRVLLAAAFAALHDAERARVRHMDEGLEALGPYADEGSDDAAS